MATTGSGGVVYATKLVDLKTKVVIEVSQLADNQGGGAEDLPVATADTLGGVKVGSGLSVTADGTLSSSGGSNVDLTPYSKKADNLSDLASKATALSNLGGAVKTDIDGLTNFAALRSREPAYEGERVYIKCHTAPALSVYLPEGGGWFIGRKTKQADDGGYVASAGGNWHWQRDKDLKDLYIGDFGGVADGITDAQPAFLAYKNFLFGTYARAKSGGTSAGAGGYSPNFALRFGAGTYFIKPGEYNKYGSKVASGAADASFNPSGYYAAGGVRIEGVAVEQGKMLATRIISDKSDAPVFLINHRRVSFHNFIWDGQQTTKVDQYNANTNPTGTNLLIGATQGVFNDTASNKQPFLKNECPGGCYARISCINAVNTGSYMFYLLDTLDSKVEQVFSSITAGPVIQVGWSGQTAGVWDHSTSLEIRNCNFGTPVAPAIWAPRCGQAIMNNCWFEHGTIPFDINNGQWDLGMICVEDCRKNPSLWYSKTTCVTLSVPTGNDFDRSSPTSGTWASYPKNPDGSDITAWTGGYDQGSWLMQNHGAYFECPVVYPWGRGYLRGRNDSDSVLWVNIGNFRNPTNGGFWRVRILGGSYYNTTTAQNILSDGLGGEATINIGRGTGTTPKISWYSEGSGPIANVTSTVFPQYQPQTSNDIVPAVWIPIRPRCGEFTVFVEGTGLTRKEAGIPAGYTASGFSQTANPGYTRIPGRFSFHTGQAGFGASGDVAAITSRSAASGTTPVDTSKPRQWLRVNVNGIEYAMPYYAYTPVITTQPIAQTVATGGTLTLTTAANDAAAYQWQKSTDSGSTWTDIANATAATYTKASVVIGDAGQYRAVIRGQLGAADATVTTNQATTNAVAVTVT
ncbi:putative EPS-depolymerase [Erwinia phage Hena1]|uniref:Putative EPS-depolymerase n=1 Tax=Erwinia phage Hena1 TaxID=2678601 RepID=A0A6B9J5W9_9CAUD|nr:EPS depolymerase [Erwinia phage Hena1]QGZ16295.1 putative EPS-depolymerase [Erwinia phage Hena1]